MLSQTNVLNGADICRQRRTRNRSKRWWDGFILEPLNIPFSPTKAVSPWNFSTALVHFFCIKMDNMYFMGFFVIYYVISKKKSKINCLLSRIKCFWSANWKTNFIFSLHCLRHPLASIFITDKAGEIKMISYSRRKHIHFRISENKNNK